MKYFILSISTLILFSCANIAKGLVAPNQCKKCEVICHGSVIETYEGCGSENVRLYEEAVVKAFETDKCSCEVICDTWRKDPEEE